MHLVPFWIALTLFGPATTAASQAGASSPQVTGSKEERAAAAAEYYAQGDFVRAALGFEGLHRDYPGDKAFLFNAAASRYGAGHAAHAVAYTREYLALQSLSAADRQEAEAQLKEAEGRVGEVVVTVTAEDAGAIEVVARHIARESGDIRPELSFSATPGAPLRLALDGGGWTIVARADGQISPEQQVESRLGAETAITLRLVRATIEPVPTSPTRGAEVPPDVVRRSVLGFGIGGGITAVAGIVVLGVGANAVGGVATCPDNANQTSCAVDFQRALLIREGGVIALGAGAGLLVGGMTWKLRDARARQRAWIGEAAAGGVAIVAGMILMSTTFASFNMANDANRIENTPEGWSAHHDVYRHSPGHAVGSVVLGLGIGSLASAAVGLGVQRRHLGRPIQVSGMTGRGTIGLSLTGRF